MSLPDLKQLKALVAFCRKTGVESIECEGFKIVLTDQPVIVRQTRQRKAKGVTDTAPMVEDKDEVDHDMLSAEDLLFYSAAQPYDAVNAENKN